MLARFLFLNSHSYLLLMLVILLTCSNNGFAKARYKAKDASAKHIDSLYYFQPVSGIAYVPEGDKITRNDSCSWLNSDILCTVFESCRASMHIAGKIEIADTSLRRRVFKEICLLIDSAPKQRYFEHLEQSSVLDSIMDAGGKRFALIVGNYGYARSAKSLKRFNRELRRAAFMNPPIWGFYSRSQDPTIAYSTSLSIMVAMVIDAKENKTYFYNTDMDVAHPLNFSDLRDQLRVVFQKFFFSKPPLERS